MMIKTTVEFFRKIDDRVLGAVNDVYLWLLDWTGVYVATLVLITAAPAFAFMYGATNRWMIGLWLTFLLIFSSHMYLVQSAGDKVTFNSLAESNRGNYLRTFFIWLNIGDTIIDLLVRNPWLHVTVDICAVLFLYLICIKIRDREKKEFKLPRLAHVTNA